MKEKTFSRNSWHFNLYKIMRGKFVNEPRNLCPYFWGGIVPGIILIIPLFLIALPCIAIFSLIDLFDNDDTTPSPLENLKEDGLLSPFSFIALLTDIVLFIIISMVVIFFTKFTDQNINGFQIAGIIGWFFTLVALGYFGTRRIIRWVRRVRGKVGIEREGGPNIIVEGVKAWYNKNCPQIKWK